MRVHRTLLALSLAVGLAGFSACQRSGSNVEAAREEKSINPDINNPNARSNTAAQSENVLSEQDKQVALKLEQAHLEEIDLGRVMKDKANNGDVKDYAKMMIDDHNNALNKIQDLLKNKGINESVTAKSADENGRMAALQNTSGPDLDRQYMAMMVQDHEKDLGELQSDVASVQNSDLKAYISDLIPVVEKHLNKAEDLENKINQGTK